MVLNAITFGSERVRDTAYFEAALDSYPTPSLFLLILFVGMAAGVPLGFFTQPISKRRRNAVTLARAELEALEGQEELEVVQRRGQLQALIHNYQKSLKKRIIFLLCGWLLGLAFLFVQLTTMNQAVLIRRVFLRDLQACAPYLSAEEEEQLRSSFAQVRIKADYAQVASELSRVARAHSVRLAEIELW
jgi:hypothetical protein